VEAIKMLRIKSVTASFVTLVDFKTSKERSSAFGVPGVRTVRKLAQTTTNRGMEMGTAMKQETTMWPTIVMTAWCAQRDATTINSVKPTAWIVPLALIEP
jgi:hypothetical protein